MTADKELALDRLLEAKGWIFDIDGTLIRTAKFGGEGGTAFAGAGELLKRLRDAGRRIMICTQASTHPPAYYTEILNAAGFPVEEKQIMTAGLAASLYLQTHHPNSRVLVLGSDGITVPLTAAGLALAQFDFPGTVDVVMVGHAVTYDSRAINAACQAVLAGASFYTTTDEVWFHGGMGRSVAPSGFMSAAIGAVCGRKADILGKPSPALGRVLLNRLGMQGHEVVVVDDNIGHGIRLAHAMGAHSVMPLSGASSRLDVESLHKSDAPTLVCEDVGELNALIRARLAPLR